MGSVSQHKGSFGSREYEGRNVRRSKPPPAQPAHNVAFHGFSDAAVCQPLGVAGLGLPTRLDPQWSLVFPSVLCLNPAGRVKPSPGPGSSSVAETWMPVSAFCLTTELWEVMCGWEQLDNHNCPGEWIVFPLRCQLRSAPFTPPPHQLYPIICRTCRVFCLHIWPKCSFSS